MKIVMAGIDYSTADLALRERFSLTKTHQRAFCQRLLKKEGIWGAVLLSTCNRTELYLSCGGDTPDPAALLCQEMGISSGDVAACFHTREGQAAFRHLCRLACGVESQIWGEDQIISQVKGAIALSREAHAADSVLEVLFRTAVTAAKRIKTELRFSRADGSIADKTVKLLQQASPLLQKVLVIGNGEIGRMVTRALLSAGLETTVTLRHYRHGTVEVPAGARAIDYTERYERLYGYDAVVSATASPHATLEYEAFAGAASYPSLLVDLAVPRDIDERIAQLPGVSLYNIDDMGQRDIQDGGNRQKAELERIIDRYQQEFERWVANRENPVQRYTHFPLFVDMRGKKVLVAGGGRVAERRVHTLCRFACSIQVVAPEVTQGIERLAGEGLVEVLHRPFAPEDLQGVFFAVAATNDREVNRQISVSAKEQGVFVSVADCAQECDVFFPAIAGQDGLVAGISGDGVAHGRVAAAARRIREVLHEEA